ncbi:MAG: hypothetical protein GY874_05885 [Desulfobacteraceae bacterium]|nr:hypothetical protein [Desulfobacteraceae bacterium]
MKAYSIFNGYIGSHLFYHLGKQGIFDLFNEDKTIDMVTLQDYYSDQEDQSRLLTPLIDYSLKFGVFEKNVDNRLTLTKLGCDLKQNVVFLPGWPVA